DRPRDSASAMASCCLRGESVGPKYTLAVLMMFLAVFSSMPKPTMSCGDCDANSRNSCIPWLLMKAKAAVRSITLTLWQPVHLGQHKLAGLWITPLTPIATVCSCCDY